MRDYRVAKERDPSAGSGREATRGSLGFPDKLGTGSWLHKECLLRMTIKLTHYRSRR